MGDGARIAGLVDGFLERQGKNARILKDGFCIRVGRAWLSNVETELGV